jgi:hypothetical protein
MILWQVMPFYDISNTGYNVLWVKMKTCKTGDNGMSYASKGDSLGWGGRCSASWSGKGAREAEGAEKSGCLEEHCEDMEWESGL